VILGKLNTVFWFKLTVLMMILVLLYDQIISMATNHRIGYDTRNQKANGLRIVKFPKVLGNQETSIPKYLGVIKLLGFA
jgi:hypothetical protein